MDLSDRERDELREILWEYATLPVRRKKGTLQWGNVYTPLRYTETVGDFRKREVARDLALRLQ